MWKSFFFCDRRTTRPIYLYWMKLAWLSLECSKKRCTPERPYEIGAQCRIWGEIFMNGKWFTWKVKQNATSRKWFALKNFITKKNWHHVALNKQRTRLSPLFIYRNSISWDFPHVNMHTICFHHFKVHFRFVCPAHSCVCYHLLAIAMVKICTDVELAA